MWAMARAYLKGSYCHIKKYFMHFKIYTFAVIITSIRAETVFHRMLSNAYVYFYACVVAHHHFAW